MCNHSEWIVREAFLAYNRGDAARMMKLIDPNFEWIYLDLSMREPGPQTRLGREELEKAINRQVDRGLRAELEQVLAVGEKVVLVMRTPGIDEYLNRQADDRTYDVVTVRDGMIIGLQGCRDRGEAQSLVGIG